MVCYYGNCSKKSIQKLISKTRKSGVMKTSATPWISFTRPLFGKLSVGLSEMPWALNSGPIVTIISTEQGDGASQIESGDRENQPLAWDSRSPFFLLPTTIKKDRSGADWVIKNEKWFSIIFRAPVCAACIQISVADQKKWPGFA